ncbi:MAG TPA: hypothetical protein VFL85_05185, partial [Candidatus Saccharimonadales bacterium]|nr:hypothetical protein [Candidatus Saccharimonadales bacterium]
AYNFRGDNYSGVNDTTDQGEADVFSTAYIYPENETTVNCGNLLRLKFEAQPHPYNPHEKPSSVKLADGRTLQIYQLSNEKECTDSWNASVNPSMITDVFKQAQSY